MNVVWVGIDTPSVERFDWSEQGGILAGRSRVETSERSYRYEIVVDADWTFRSLMLQADGIGMLDLRHTDDDWIVDGEPRPDLAAAIDIDLAFSPMTNSLPVRRLALDLGEAAEITVAYVAATTLEVRPLRQRYTRLGEHTYRYASLDSGFTEVVRVDDEGFVVDYPGLFRRTVTRAA